MERTNTISSNAVRDDSGVAADPIRDVDGKMLNLTLAFSEAHLLRLRSGQEVLRTRNVAATDTATRKEFRIHDIS